MLPMMDDTMKNSSLMAATLKRAYRDDLPDEMPAQFARLLDAFKEQDKAVPRPRDRH